VVEDPAYLEVSAEHFAACHLLTEKS
jgi:hypothetical protein